MAGNYFAFHLNVELSMSNSFTHMQILNQEIKVIKAVPKFTKNYITIRKPQKCIALFLSKNMLWWSLYLYWGEWVLWEAGGQQWAFDRDLPWEQFQKPRVVLKVWLSQEIAEKNADSRIPPQSSKTEICVDGVLEFAFS